MSHRLSTALCCAALVSSAHAVTAWDESASGDLSNAGLAPTALALVPGSNVVAGTTGRSGGVVDRDYFSFTVAPGWQLEALTMLPGTTFIGSSSFSFIAVQAGPQVTVSPTSASPVGLLGWWHYSANDLGTDILPSLGTGPGATGFAGPLPAGSYAFWIQETSNGSPAYRFDFQITPVPEPTAAWLFGVGLAGLALRRRSAG